LPKAAVHTSPILTTMVVSWAITEIPRYIFYAVNLVTTPPRALVVLRYSTFIPMYPSGAGSEWGLIFISLNEIWASKRYSYALPNDLNVIFDFYWCCIVLLALYLPGLPFMYSHMISQRKKALGPAKQKTQ
jgi:very-long-chain (3R)-3-hydroxyacyl-CoA dehydratase